MPPAVQCRMRMLAALLVPAALLAQASAKESALGRSLAAGVERDFDTLADPYVNGIGARMAAVAGYRQPLAIRITKDPKPRAAVFPGGYIFLSSGLIGGLRGEAELAGVLAHDLAHLQDPAARPAANTSIPVVWGCLWWGKVPGAVRSAAGAAGAAEAAADRDAVHFLSAAGYDPYALPDLYGRLHGRTAEAATLAQYVRGNFPPAESAVISTGEFSAMQLRVAPPRHAPNLLRPN